MSGNNSVKSHTSNSPTSSVKQVSLPSSKGSHTGPVAETSRTSSHSGSVPRDAKPPQPRKYNLLTTPVVKPTLEEYQIQQLKKKPLFADILTLDDGSGYVQSDKTLLDQSILVTGFGIRNLESLQNALQDEENKRLHRLYKYQAEESRTSKTSSTSTLTKSVTKSIETETEISSAKSDISTEKQKLEYLMGLTTVEEEGQLTAFQTEVDERDLEEFTFSASVSMRVAQKYLRTHRIFDFFQFIIAHLLSALPENPIGFILTLLGKCLMYRSGLGSAPLLYEEKHIEELYRLMDRMQTGYIELEQYMKGMATLGIHDFNKKPPLFQDSMVDKKTFIQEALEAETALFEDLIKRKWMGKKPAPEPSFTDAGSSCQSFVGPYFIPSDLLRGFKEKDGLAKVSEEENTRGDHVTR